MCALVLESSNGDISVIPDDALLVWIDETGNEDLSDSNYPLFGLGGCVVPVHRYEAIVKRPWEHIKSSVFGGASSLHASDLRNPSQEQIAALSEFFKKGQFGRIASLVSRSTSLIDEIDPYETAAMGMLKRFEAVTENAWFSQVAFIVEASERGNELAKKYLSRLSISRTYSDGRTSELPMHFGFMPKSLNEAGLEVADFIMHAAGGEVRARERGGQGPLRPDYKVTFKPDHSNLASFVLVTDVKLGSA